jgi:hypothetical protein
MAVHAAAHLPAFNAIERVLFSYYSCVAWRACVQRAGRAPAHFPAEPRQLPSKAKPDGPRIVCACIKFQAIFAELNVTLKAQN